MAKKTEKFVTVELPTTMSVPLQRGIGERELDISKLTAETVASLVMAGTRETSGNAGGTPKEGQTAEEAVIVAFARIQANEHSFGGGGGRLAPEIVVGREFVGGALVHGGMKRAEATKLVLGDLRTAFDLVYPDDTEDERDAKYASMLIDAKASYEQRKKDASKWHA